MDIIGSIYTITIALLLLTMIIIFIRAKEVKPRITSEELSMFNLEEKILPEDKVSYNKKITDVCWLGSNKPYKYQSISVLEQLLLGVRCFYIGVYWVKIIKKNIFFNKIEEYLALDSNGDVRVDDFFNIISRWLKTHPQSIITIIINSHMNLEEPIPGQEFTNRLRIVIDDLNLKTLCYKFKNLDGVPTIGELLLKDKRLILINKYNLIPMIIDNIGWINTREMCTYSKAYSKKIIGKIVISELNMISYITHHPDKKLLASDWTNINLSHRVAGAVFKFKNNTGKYPTYIIGNYINEGDSGGIKKVIKKINENKLKVIIKN